MQRMLLLTLHSANFNSLQYFVNDIPNFFTSSRYYPMRSLVPRDHTTFLSLCYPVTKGQLRLQLLRKVGHLANFLRRMKHNFGFKKSEGIRLFG